MLAVRSRLGCDECRRRRRKCDEAKPACGPCVSARRDCRYTLKIVRGMSTFSESRANRKGPTLSNRRTVHDRQNRNDDTRDDDAGPSVSPVSPFILVRLPNGVPLAPPYQRLLDYFTRDVLASLSVHPAIHRDLAEDLVPAMLHAPHLLSAGLALAATGLASRGLSDVGGVGLPRMIQHLQTSGLALLRQALENNNSRGSSLNRGDSSLVATCLLWCLADVFAADAPLSSSLTSSSSSSWRIHLQGIEALLGGARALDAFVTRGRSETSSSSSSRSAMGHLHQLYRSLQTLPHVARRRHVCEIVESEAAGTIEMAETSKRNDRDVILANTVDINIIDAVRFAPKSTGLPRIDGFLGYSEELLDILQQVEEIACMLPPTDVLNFNNDDDNTMAAPHLTDAARISANDLLARAQAQALALDDWTSVIEEPSPPRVIHIPAPALTAAAAREFFLCHGCFQQATLIHVYRRLFRLPSRAPLIQAAVTQIRHMAGQMTQGAPCSAWVAMALPLFTAGCEAYTPTARAWVDAALAAFAASIGSRHVQLLHRALEDIWQLRLRRGDADGRLCAGPLLGELNYNIILF